MTKFAVLAAAAAFLAAPVLMTPAKAAVAADSQTEYKVAQVEVRIGDRRNRHRHMHRHRHCETKVVYRNGRKTVIKRCG